MHFSVSKFATKLVISLEASLQIDLI